MTSKAPGRHRRRATETSDFVAMMLRIVNAYGDRIAADPAALVHYRDIENELRDAVNRGIFEANRGENHYSQNDIGAILGVTHIAIHKRIGLGENVYAEMQQRRGAGALFRIADIRRTRAELLRAAEVTD